MTNHLNQSINADLEELTSALKDCDDKSAFLSELMEFIESKGMTGQFLDVVNRTLGKESYENIKCLINNK